MATLLIPPVPLNTADFINSKPSSGTNTLRQSVAMASGLEAALRASLQNGLKIAMETKVDPVSWLDADDMII